MLKWVPLPGKVYKYNVRMAPFPTRSASFTLRAMSRPTAALTLLLAGTLACGMRTETGLLPVSPPAPLDSMPVASDVRVDSAGRLVGSFVGEGTSRAVHLLSSDTLLIRTLAGRFRPDLLAGGSDLWTNLRREDSVSLGRSERRRTLETELRRAIPAGEIEPWFQPIIDSMTGRMVGVEVLARWRHPEKGLLAPGAFVPMAEELGLIGVIGVIGLISDFLFKWGNQRLFPWSLA